MQGINLLKKHGVEWNAMAVINDFNAEYPLEFYRFFKEIGCQYIQFAPIVERILSHEDGRHLASLAENKAGTLADFSITPEQWGNFLCTLFDEWVKEDVGKYYVQIFDSTLANWMGEQPGICTMAKTCGHAGVMEFNGDVYSCDHFVFPEYKLGNIYSKTLVEPGLNYLCKGYYQFFKHVAPYMDFMKNELMNQRPPANIMEALRNGVLRVES